MRVVLLDTGPIVGLLNRRDPHHRTSVGAIRASAASGRRVCATWEVVAEAYTLIRRGVPGGRTPEPALEVLRWAWESGATILGAVQEDHSRAADLLREYEELRLSYVDALLMAVAERHGAEEIVTVDGAHFGAVRLAGSPSITVA